MSHARMSFLLFCLIAGLPQPAFAEADDRPLMKLQRHYIDITSLFQPRTSCYTFPPTLRFTL
jgi:hypothetical protein